MTLGVGEYIIISSCVRAPYNFIHLINLISKLETYGARFEGLKIIKVHPQDATYDLIWQGKYYVSKLDKFYIEDLKTFVLESVDFILKDSINARLQVNFFDDLSYEVCIMFNYSKLVEGIDSVDTVIKRFEMVEEVAMLVFYEIMPVYGLIAVEKSVCGIKSILNDECVFPSDKAFYSTDIVNAAKPLLQPIIDKALYKKTIENCGVYFRKTQTNNFELIETYDERIVLDELKKYFLYA